MVGTSETRMAGTSGTRDGWNQWDQETLAGTSGTRDGRN
jgi:hypothetical protein